MHRTCNDDTFAAQLLLTPRLPIRELTTVRKVNTLNNVLISEAESLTLDVFNNELDSLRVVPVSLQNALSYRRAFWNFFRLWDIGGHAAISEDFEIADREADLETLLWAFIDRYEGDTRDFRERIHAYVDDNSSDTDPGVAGDPARSATERWNIPVNNADPASKLFAEKTADAFDALARGETKWFPPHD